ncbi:purine-nucleoside phosphorylase [bacterium]|nr:MAG: purine-nucleoside phosphorylase [bacterium]
MDMDTRQQQIQESVSFVRAKTRQHPSVGLILGSGLGDFADTLPGAITIAASDIPHYPVSTVEGHRGRLVFSTLGSGLTVIAFQGRVHFYESRDVHTVTFPVRLAHALGVHTLLVTNAAGGINKEFSPGDLMLISDQLDFTWENSLRILTGTARTRRFLYDPELLSRAAETAASLGIRLRTGVYAGVKGPSYETAAEVEMIRRLGGDVVGMSTVLEAHLASALGMRLVGISCITNKATGIGGAKLNHQEVTEVANRVRHDFSLLLNGILQLFA